MADLLTPADYPAVRALLNVTLSPASLPDSVIGLSIFAGSAVLEVQARDPAWATRTGTAWQHLKNAAALLTAANLAPTLPQIMADSFGDVTVRVQPQDGAALAAQLRARAADEIAIVVPAEAAADFPVAFTTAPGYRGRWG